MIKPTTDHADINSKSPKYRLLRESDHLVKVGNQLRYVEWDEDGKFKEAHKEPKIGFSLLLDPHPLFYSWLTTPITEILEESENGSYLKFKTQNSTYELFIDLN